MLVALAVARTALSNRLARLQVLQGCGAAKRGPACSRQHCSARSWPAPQAAVLSGRPSSTPPPPTLPQGYLFRAAFLRRVPLFARNLVENVMLCALAGALEASARSAVSYLELQWRRMLTRRLHADYFEDMASTPSPGQRSMVQRRPGAS